MNLIINWKRHLFVNSLLGAIIIFFPSLTWLSIAIGFTTLYYCSFIIGQLFFRRENISLSNLYGFIILLAFVTTFGFLSIHLQFFSLQFFWLLNLVTIIVTTVLLYKKPIAFSLILNNNLPRPKNVFIAVAFLFFSFIAWQQLYLNATEDSLRSPWQVTPNLFFIAYTLATFCLFFALRFSKTKTEIWHLTGLYLHFFLSVCASIVVYKLGSDYDPFIHKTNVNLLLENGQLLPTPIYYLGQYATIVFTHVLTKIDTAIIDTYLLPVISALIIPTLFYNLGKTFNLKHPAIIALSSVSMLFLPLKTFTVTTPQAMANLFALTAIILLVIAIYKKTSLWPAWLAIIISCLTHVIAGLPVAIIMGYLSIDRLKFFSKWPGKLVKLLKVELILMAIMIIPIAFLFNAQKTASQLKVDIIDNPWQKLTDLFLSIPNFNILNYISFHDYIYNFNNWRWLLILVFMGAGYYVIKNLATKEIFNKLVISFFTLVIASGLLTISIDFFSLVNGEKNIYPQRLLELSLYFLTPIIFFGIYGSWHKIHEQTRLQELIFLILIISFIGSNLYLSYPRVDRISESNGYSTSVTDMETVAFIEKIANNKYVVLASQPVSAAAISSYGFAHYYNDYFYYPVPTGGRLYQLFEDLAFRRKKPSETIYTTRYLTGVQDIYFVLNRYWSGADEAIIFYKNTADTWYSINDKNFIFVYKNNDVIDNMADKRLQEVRK